MRCGPTTPWTGLCGFLDRAIALQAAHRGFAEIVTAHLRDEKLVARARSRLRPLLERLIERAQEAEALRDDVVYEDLSVLLWACGRVADSTRDVAPDYWRRHLALTLDGLRADGASPCRGRRSRPVSTARRCSGSPTSCG